MPRISISWLRDHVEVPAGTTTEQLARDLVRVGIEEEQIIPAAVTGPLVAGTVLSIDAEEQKNGKSIRYCRVDVGPFNDEPETGAEPSSLPSRGIICGASNFSVGDTVVVSLPGAVLPGPFPISARKTYGHISDGMICSARELGLGEDHDGIIVLNEQIPVAELPEPGQDVIEFLGLGEEILEVNVTPDRGYCFAVRGLAREYAHSTGASFTDLGMADALTTESIWEREGAFEVQVDADSWLEQRPACDRFVTRVVRGIDPTAPTPKWMVQRLEQAGMRSLSLPVDVTNYVMLDLGQPLHAYDLAFVQAPIVVRRGRAGEVFTTLDGNELSVNSEDILITDSPNGQSSSRIVGLAGVMGGLDSEVKNDTTDVVIEAAHFDPVSVARTARRHRVFSEASKRFERGVDPLLAPVAATRAAELIAKYGQGTIDSSGFDLNTVAAAEPIRFDSGEVARLTSLDLPVETIESLLVEIGCDVHKEESEGSVLFVTAPSWRPDLDGPAHLVEEVARLYGYDLIPTRLPKPASHGGLLPEQVIRRRVHQTVTDRGLVEVKSYPFVADSHDRQGLAPKDPRRSALRLRNPLADDAALLRTSILDTLLETAERNASRGVAPLALYEVGQIALPGATVPSPILGVDTRPDDTELRGLLDGVPAQPWRVAGVMGGAFAPRSGPELESGIPVQPGWDWADAIEAVRVLAEANGVRVESTRSWLPGDVNRRPGPPLPPLSSDPNEVAPWHPARCATLFVRAGKGYRIVGHAGELHPNVCEEFGLPARSVAFEVDLDALSSLVPQSFLRVKPISSYPLAKEDLAFVVDDVVPQEDILAAIRRAAGPLLESATLFDVYRGDQVPKGSRSLAYALSFRSADRTLSAAEVQKVREEIVAMLSKRFGATLRA